MRFRALVNEAWRDIATSTTKAWAFAFALAAAIGLLAVADASAVADARMAEAEFRQSGAAVQLLQAAGYVDGRRCEAMAVYEPIDSAGALRAGERLTALALPSTRLAVHEVTSGLLSLIEEIAPVSPGSEVNGAGVWLTRDLADTLGVTPGGSVATTAGPMLVSGVFGWPDDGRDRELGFSVLAPVPADGFFDRCYASAWPPHFDITGILFYAADSEADNPPSVIQLNGSMGANFSISALLENRTTRWALPISLVTGLAIGYIATRMRRLEIAGALHARISRTSLTWIHLLETVAWSLVALICVTAVITWFAKGTGVEAWREVMRTGMRVATIGATAAPLGAILAVSTIREKLLFRYFKDR